MTTLRYTPGSWRAVVTPQGVAVLPGGVDAAMLETIWASLGAGNGLGAVLESLTGAFGTSLRSIPPFAVATVSGTEVRVAVRGELAVDIVEGASGATAGSMDAAASAGPLVVSGADVTTWSERVVASAASVTVRTPAAPTAGDASADWYPLGSGVVLAAAVTLDLAGIGLPTAAAAAPSVVQPTTVEPATADGVPAPAPVAAASHVSADAQTGIEPAPEIPEATLLPEEIVAEAEVPSPAAEPAPEDESAAEEEPAIEDEPAAEEESAPTDEVSPVESSALAEELEYTRDELPDDAYDHLWGATVVKSVEEAAVRELDDDEHEEAASSSPAPAPAPTAAPAPEPAPATAEAAVPVPGFAPPAAPAASPAPPVSSGLIDGIPNFGGVGAASSSENLVGRTVPPAAPSAAPAVSAAAPAAPAAPAGDDDHDGLTVTVSELEAMRRLGEAQSAAPALPSSALGRIVLSTGETHALDRPVIIGRRPRANRVQGDQMPTLVTVASPEQDISRNHLEVRLEGRHVLVVDLATTNGSVLHREGTPPLRLGPNEPVLALSGDIVDIGDGITVAFEEIP